MQTVTNYFVEAAQKGGFIRKMFEKGLELKALYGEDAVCDFSLGNPDVPPPEVARDILHKIADDAIRPLGLGYCPNAGIPAVRESIAQYLSKQQELELKAKDVVMTVGAASALVDFFRATVEPGDEIIVPSPYFVEYGNYCGHFGGVLKPVETNEDFSLNIKAIEEAITSKTRAIIVNSPNNPTGAIYSENELRALAALIDKINLEREKVTGARALFLLSDEPYRVFAYDGVEVPPVLPMTKYAIVLGSFSKTLSMAGERVGYLAINPKLSEEDGGTLLTTLILVNRTLGYVNAPVIGQKLAAAICNETVDLEIYARRRALMAKVLTDAGVEFTMPKGAFYFFPKAPGGDDTKFVDALLKERILAVPGRGFGRAGYIRLSCSVDEKIIARSAEGFKRAVEACK
ncbi:MAG: pyridoxal phosphate-dependent aminotransferase [Kiritimatiellae bacterium]|nr:pyridoxal phosphate-dependent aminotransferase [Kiritimatiellia bacterium]